MTGVSYGESMDRLLEELGRLPGVGRRTAERLAHHILRLPDEQALRLAVAIRDVKRHTLVCSQCGNIGDEDPCRICSDARRDPSVICVVETPRDVAALEAASAFRGRYHVLGGKVSPLDGVSAADLSLERLRARAAEPEVEEIVVATSPDLEGDGTALYVERVLRDLDVRVTRISRGVPTGYSLENSSAAMLTDAVRGRRAVPRLDPDDTDA